MLCSGGVYASMDLSLYLVEKFCGHEWRCNVPRPGSSTCRDRRNRAMPRCRCRARTMRKKCGPAKASWSGTTLAQDLGMSPRNFPRRFKRATGRLPSNYLQAMRVAIAKEMLDGGARAVQVVSAAVGYEDAAFFRGLFKRAIGMTPGA